VGKWEISNDGPSPTARETRERRRRTQWICYNAEAGAAGERRQKGDAMTKRNRKSTEAYEKPYRESRGDALKKRQKSC